MQLESQSCQCGLTSLFFNVGIFIVGPLLKGFLIFTLISTRYKTPVSFPLTSGETQAIRHSRYAREEKKTEQFLSNLNCIVEVHK